MKNRVVDPNSIQSQFAALNSDRDAFRLSEKNNKREFDHEQRRLQTLRSKQAEISEHIRVAHTVLGEENKKRQLLNAEEQRLKKIFKHEKDEIISIISELNGLEDENKIQKNVHVNEMDTLIYEIDKEIKTFREKSVMRQISVSNLNTLLATRISEELRREEKQLQLDQTTSSTRWKVIADQLSQSIESLGISIRNMTKELKEKRFLETKKQNLRKKMILSAQTNDGFDEPLGDLELDELERLWENEIDNEVDSSGNIDNSNENGEQTLHTSQAQQSLNMSLFYSHENQC